MASWPQSVKSTIKPASLNEMPQPTESWEQFDAARQKKYNTHLVGGLAFFAFTLGVVSLIS